MKWSILILTIPGRDDFREKLLNCLQPQMVDGTEIKLMWSNPLISIGENRQIMLEQAEGEYVCFIDDDDMVSPVYVKNILPLLDGVDYVGFPVKVLRDGKLYGVSYHSLKHKECKTFAQTAFRDISHLNPIRRELALQAKFHGDFGEDSRWADALRDLGIVKTQNYIPEPMYYYQIRTHKPEMATA